MQGTQRREKASERKIREEPWRMSWNLPGGEERERAFQPQNKAQWGERVCYGWSLGMWQGVVWSEARMVHQLCQGQVLFWSLLGTSWAAEWHDQIHALERQLCRQCEEFVEGEKLQSIWKLCWRLGKPLRKEWDGRQWTFQASLTLLYLDTNIPSPFLQG